MKILRIEIAGFKSFADKVVLDFQQGVTGVVGPNGCGKSNIVDAIRWCMGEQSAKNLRGKAMDDVIFAGSESRKPLGMAEVSLVFSTEDGRAPANYLEFSEIQLTRRLYRNGDSEYLINKTPCRLLDISELFMDTGVGNKAYSIIEQGKIGQILHSRPEERRLLIEEAAGVTKYKARKQVALKKIEVTRQNLLRLDDLLGEIKRNLNSLQRQSKKAEKFRGYREELRELDLLVVLHQAEFFRAEKKKLELQLAEMQHSLNDADGISSKSDNQVELQRLELLEAEKKLNLQQEELFKIKADAIASESALGFMRREKDGFVERIARYGQELQSITEGLNAVKLDLKVLEDRKQAGKNSLNSAEEQLKYLQGAQNEREEAFEELNLRTEALRRELFSAKGMAEQHKTKLEESRKRLLAVSERLKRHQEEQTALLESLSGADLRREAAQTELLSQSEEQKTVRLEFERITTEEQGLREKLPAVESMAQAKRDELSRQSSRLTSLQELERQFAGYGQGVRLLMTESPLRESLSGIVADVLQVPEEYEVAVEAVLAERLQAVICENEHDLLASVRFLKEGKGGKAQLVLPSDILADSAPVAGVISLISLLQLAGKYSARIARMLANVYLVEDLESALALARSYPEKTFVTRGGELLSSDGTLTGGSSEGANEGIMHRKREIRTLEEQEKVLQGQLKGVEEERDSLRLKLHDITSKIHGGRNNIHRLELVINGLTKDIQQIDSEVSRLNERLKLLVHEKRALEEEQAELFEQQKAAAAGQEESEQLAIQLEDASQKVLAESEAERRVLVESRELLTKQRVVVATIREQLEADIRAEASLLSQREQFGKRVEKNQKENAEAELASQNLSKALETEEKRLKFLMDQQIENESTLRQLRELHESASVGLKEAENAARLSHAERDRLRQAYGELNLQSRTVEMQMQSLEQSLEERYRLSLAEIIERIGEKEFHEEEAQLRRMELDRMIAELGEVNLMAIEECAGMEQRYDFLSSQKSDLEESLHDLQQAIQRINRTTRKRFLEAFTQINEKFQEVFPRLFCGGKAELKLTDEQDLLETGIDIIVQPPGKKLANVMLLSGGEKALTAVALIFSIFLIKPTPFCLLDEVDAPLDDANIGRFNEMVREMSSISQFIIITHNKATMAVSDTLYGITMEEPGASRLVSVRLH